MHGKVVCAGCPWCHGGHSSLCMQTLIGMLKIVIKTYNEQIAVAAQIVSVRVGDCGSFLEITGFVVWVCMGIKSILHICAYFKYKLKFEGCDV